ncbi:CHAP domain-containing protein [bacterium]|nr:MAG: CHAP domain-containing protein [bacterium]
MLHKNKNKSGRLFRAIFGGLFLFVAVVSATVWYQAQPAHADDLQPLIDAVTRQIQDNQAIVNQKQAEGDTLQNRLTAIQAELSAARSNLELTRLRIDQTKLDRKNTEADLKKTTELLRQNIAAAYKQGDISPIEILASSENLSDFVGRQEYYDALRKKITENVDSIKLAKKQLEEFSRQLKIKEEQQRLEEKAIAAKETEQAELLAKTRGDEAIYRALVEADTTRLATLRAQQSAAIAAQSLGRNFSLTTEYPWTAVEPFPSRGVDPWGFYYRQCTSYAAWKRASIGRPLPAWGFLGPANAKQWPEWAGKFGMRVDTTPEVGAAAVYPVGEYGHVMIVEGIVSNGAQVLVSEFNADWGGHYSQSLWPVSSLIFIH